MATYVNDLRLKEIATGDEAGTWGTSTNTNLELIGEAFSFGTEAITTNADTHTTTVADGSTDPGRSMYLKYTGTLDSACTITIGPNTISKMWFIENATSGSQNIIISQGSGANITIPAGDTKAVYSDGAGSGAAFVDAFASLNVVDLKVQDDLTVTDDMTVGGTLGVTGVLTGTSLDISGDIDVDGTTNLDVVDIDGAVNMATTLLVTGNVDFNGNLDVDGTTNLDVVDIDGAVDMASTLTVAGVLTGASLDISGNIDIDGITNLDVVDIDGAVDMATTLAVAGNVDFNGDLDVDGTTNLDAVDIDGAVDMASTLGVTGVVTANAGVVVDEMTIDGDTLTATDEFIIDAASHIKLDADSGNIIFRDAGSNFSKIINSSGDVLFSAETQDKDIKFNGNDGGAAITALSLDMSDAGTAIFNHDIQIADSGLLRMGAGGDLIAFSDGTNALINANNGNLTLDVAGDIILDADGGDLVFKDGGTDIYKINTSSSNVSLEAQVSDANIIFKGNDGGSEITALTLDISEGGTALFNGDVVIGHTAAVGTVHKGDLQVKSAISILDGSNTTAATFGLWSSGANAAFISVDPDQEGDNSVLHFIMDAGIKMTLDSIGRLNIDQVESRLGTGALNITGEVGQSNNAIQFRHNASTVVGTVVTSASATAYNTSSDYRLKENVDYTWDATTRLKQLKPARFNFITDADTLVDGFLAHEVSSIVPEAITGAKDAVDADGNPDYQGIDQSKLVPLLVKTIQELEARITALES